MIVLDASVLIKVLLPGRNEEQDVVRALDLWHIVSTGRIEIGLPPHWPAEIATVLTRLSPTTALDDVQDLIAMAIPVLGDSDVFRLACHLSLELDHHVFDTLYHAVALQSADGVLVTADERYFRKAQPVGRIIRLAEYEVDE